mgnify:FL=1
MRRNFLSQNLIFLRNQKGLKQSEIQDLTGFKRNTWSNWENGKVEPGIENILIIAQFFDIDPGRLIFEDLSKGNLIKQKGVSEKTKKGNLKGNPMGNLIDDNPPDQAAINTLKEALELAHQEIKRRDETIRQKDDLIEALRGQVEALKMAAKALEATINSPKSQRKAV